MSNTAPAKPKRHLRRRFVFLLFLGLLVALVLYPPTLRTAIALGLKLSASRDGVALSIGRVEGSFFEPIRLHGVKLASVSRAGTGLTLNIAEAEARFSISNLIFKRGGGWFDRLDLNGVDGKVLFPSEPVDTSEPGRSSGTWLTRIVPANFDARRMNLRFQGSGGNTLRFNDLEFSASGLEPGRMRCARIDLDLKRLNKRFFDVRATTAIQNAKLTVADLKLQEGITIKALSANLDELVNGKIQLHFNADAFDGLIDGDISSAPSKHGLHLEAAGSFSKISIAHLAAFAGTSAEAGGTIDDGRFSFSGSPENPAKATMSVRLQATAFRWGKRQWKSLVAGATFVNRNIQIPELRLEQVHNRLVLSGQMAIPADDTPWWQTAFDFKVAGQIDNLTELSELVGPGLAQTSGKLVVDGSVRSENRSVKGELSVSGYELTYRTAPLDTLRAQVRLNGDEIQITELNFTRKEDYLKGTAAVTFLGKRRYSGELECSVADLALYSAILQPPIVPEPFTGGVVLHWSGDGTENAHSGAVRAEFKKLQPLTPKPDWPPLDVSLEGTYSPESLFFSKFAVADKSLSLSAKVTANPDSIRLEAIRLLSKDKVWVEGESQLPLKIWRSWPNLTWDRVVDGEGELAANLTFRSLRLAELDSLARRQWAVAGELSGTLQAGGTPNAPQMSGRLQLGKGEIAELHGIQAEATFDGPKVSIEKFQTTLRETHLEGSGQVNFNSWKNPELDLALSSKGFVYAPFQDYRFVADLDLRVTGRLDAARAEGTAAVRKVENAPRFELAALFKHSPALPQAAPLFHSHVQNWIFNVNCTSATPLPIPSGGTVQPDLRLIGKGDSPSLSGLCHFNDVPLASQFTLPVLSSGSILWDEKGKCSLAVRFSGSAMGTAFEGYTVGPATEKKTVLVSELPEESLRDAILLGIKPAELMSPP